MEEHLLYKVIIGRYVQLVDVEMKTWEMVVASFVMIKWAGIH